MHSLIIPDILPRESVREYAYRVLRNNILSLVLLPGTAMSEKEISTALNISRTPVREAFIRLSQEGLLEILPQRGTYVAKIDTSQIYEFKFLRETLEQAIIKIACTDFPASGIDALQKCLEQQQHAAEQKDTNEFYRLDNEMHSIIFSCCNMPNIWRMICEANLNYIRARLLDVSARHDEITLLIHQHRQIVKAIIDKDIELGITSITQHVSKVLGDVEKLKTSHPELFK